MKYRGDKGECDGREYQLTGEFWPPATSKWPRVSWCGGHEKLKLASRRFLRAAQALRGTLAQLPDVSRPAGDQARLSRWFGFHGTEAELLAKPGHYLGAGKRATAEGMMVRLEGTARRAINVVFAFQFKYCRFEPLHFTEAMPSFPWTLAGVLGSVLVLGHGQCLRRRRSDQRGLI